MVPRIDPDVRSDSPVNRIADKAAKVAQVLTAIHTALTDQQLLTAYSRYYSSRIRTRFDTSASPSVILDISPNANAKSRLGLGFGLREFSLTHCGIWKIIASVVVIFSRVAVEA